MYRFSVSSKGIILFLLEIIVCIISCLYPDINMLSILCFVQTILSLLLTVSLGFGLISIPFIFLSFTWLFHGSQFFMNVFNNNYRKPFDIINLVSGDIAKNTLLFIILSLFFLTLGIASGTKSIRKINDAKIKQVNVFFDSDKTYYVGKLLVLVCLIPRMYIDMTMILSRISNGYLSTYSNSYSGIFSTFAYGFYIGILLLIAGKRSNKKYCRHVLLITLIYIGVTMISGRRGTQTAFLCALLIVYRRYVETKKITLSKVLSIIVLLYIGLSGLMAFGDLRNFGEVSLLNYWNAFLINLQGELVLNLVGEFGSTGISLAYAIESFPSFHPFNFGKTYAISFLQVFPNIGGILDNFSADFMFVKAFPNAFQYALGGSYLGELYYNFGFAGVIACTLIGYFVSKIAIRLDYSMAQQRNLSIKDMGLFLLLPNIIIWVRGYFYSFIRVYFCFILMFYFLYKMTHKTTKHYIG